tara:strand:- start:571 stop:1035 length:465 start_codon:yes stop_codon:yes gene_type:complete
MYKCYIKNINYDCTIKRSYIQFKNNNNKLIVSFFDITQCKLVKNVLIIKAKNIKKLLFINSNRINGIYDSIKTSIYNLNMELNLPELITDKKMHKDWICNICLDNNINSDIVEMRCCKNNFHFNCILAFVKSNKLFNCPMCRNNRCILCLGKGC